MSQSREIATLGGGCFWCTEAVFQRVKGVTSVTSGYAGGTKPNPTYEDLHWNNSGYAEVIQIEFDSSIISYEKLLEIFFGTHNPTTLNRQGADVGEEYRSIIFYHNEDQKKTTEDVIDRLNKEYFDNQIVTEVKPFGAFYKAESYHQNFYNKNSYSPYCMIVINPKLAKLRSKFKDYLNE